MEATGHDLTSSNEELSSGRDKAIPQRLNLRVCGATAAPASGDPAVAVREIQQQEAATTGPGEDRYGWEWRSTRTREAMEAVARRRGDGIAEGRERPALAGLVEMGAVPSVGGEDQKGRRPNKGRRWGEPVGEEQQR